MGEIERIKLDAIEYVDKMFQRPINRNNDLVAFTRFNANVEDALRHLSRGELMDLVRDLAFDFAIAGRWDRQQAARAEIPPGSETNGTEPFWPLDPVGPTDPCGPRGRAFNLSGWVGWSCDA